MAGKKIIVGIIFIVIGASLAIGGVLTITGEPSGNTVNRYSGDIYTSPTFNFSNNMVLIMVSSDNSSAGLVSCTEFTEHASGFNTSNIGNYTVTPEKYIDGEPYYANLSGTYRYIIITGHKPTMNYNFIKESEFLRVTDASYIAALGARLTGSGIILAMVAILFRKINSHK